MRIFSFYLPQFHEIPENDQWWGKGFTEWVKVKEAKPLYDGHQQPKYPLGGNYYNLLKRETVEWQINLAKKYGIDGFIYYHYYFQGKLLLEKPAENYLRWNNISHSYFFCWANHPWKRSWEGKSEILLPMEYGDKDDWERHFQYLLQFFLDSRYEKIDNMPLLIIFESSFKEKEDMMKFFDERCREEGFNGLYLIEGMAGRHNIKKISKKLTSVTKRVYIREPDYEEHRYYLRPERFFYRVFRKVKKTLIQKGIIKNVMIYDGNRLMQQKLKYEPDGDRIIHGLWFEWDNTPRHGVRGYIITPYQKKCFEEYMNKIKHEDYLFINAWNEWAEGMMLEPTEEDGYKYLKWIKESSHN